MKHRHFIPAMVLILLASLLISGVSAAEPESKALLVSADGAYPTIQSAIDHIDTQEDKEGWTITVSAGAYDRFTVLGGLNGLTVQAAENETVTVRVCDNSAPPVKVGGAFPDTAGVSIRNAVGVTLKGLTFEMGGQTAPWYAAAVSNYSETNQRGDDFTVTGCKFMGTAPNIGVFVNTGTTKFKVTDSLFVGMKEAVGMYGDGTLMGEAMVTGNTFADCSFAIHGYYGGTGEAGVLTFAHNVVTGGDTCCKIVIQDQLNTGAIRADVRDNRLTNAIVGLVNLREEGETVSPVMDSNEFKENSFYVEAVEPGTFSFYTSFRAPDGLGYWSLTGKEDFDVDWGKNPDGSTAKIEELIAAANAAGSHELNITGVDEENLIKTFTWFKDGIYWVSIKELYIPVEKQWADSDNKDGLRPESVTLHLLADGVDTGETLVLSAENGWQGIFTGIPEEEGFVYTVTEEEVPGYTAAVTGSAADGYVVTNTHTIAPPPPPVDVNPPTGDGSRMLLAAAAAILTLGAALALEKKRNTVG